MTERAVFVLRKKKHYNQYHVPSDDSFGELPDDETMNVVSGTECTGMVPTPPLSDGEADAYREIYDVPVEQNPAAPGNPLDPFDPLHPVIEPYLSEDEQQ